MKGSTEIGFTLLEVIVALAIAVATIAIAANIISGALRVAWTAENRLMAIWISSDRFMELRATRSWPNPGASTMQLQSGGRDWYLTQTVSDTSDPDIRRVEIEVYLDQDRTALDSSFVSFIARFKDPEPEEHQSGIPPSNGNGDSRRAPS